MELCQKSMTPGFTSLSLLLRIPRDAMNHEQKNISTMPKMKFPLVCSSSDSSSFSYVDPRVNPTTQAKQKMIATYSSLIISSLLIQYPIRDAQNGAMLYRIVVKASGKNISPQVNMAKFTTPKNDLQKIKHFDPSTF